MAKNKPAKKDDWEDLPVENDDWEDVPSNPSERRASMSLARRAAATVLPPVAIANFLEEVTGGSPKDAAIAAADTATLGNLRYSDRARKEIERGERESPGSTKFGRGAGYAGLAGASMLAPSTIPAMVTIGGAQGLLTKPEGDNDLGEDIQKRGKQGLIGAGTSAAVGALAKGAGMIGDRVMQKAVNTKDYIKGMGKRMADEGLIGTRGMMRNQIAKKLPKREAKLTEATRNVRGVVRPGPVARQIQDEGERYIPKSPIGRPIPVPSNNQPFVDAAQERTLEAMARGTLNPQEAISTSRAIAKPAYNKMGDPLDAFKHKVSQTEAIALKDAVKELADAQGVPGVREALASEQALISARGGLSRPEPMNEALVRQLVRGTLGLGVGGAAGGIPGAVAGAAATTPMGMSAIGQLGVQGERILPKLSPAAIDLLIKQAIGGQNDRAR